jgi:AAA domain
MTGPQDFSGTFDEVRDDPGEQKPTGNGKASPRSRLRQTSSQFVADFVPPDYLLDGVLQRRFLYSFTGRTGSGKTAVVLLLAASVALGRKIGELEVAPGRVFYFCGENPDDVRMRWIALAQQMDFDIDMIDVDFFPGPFPNLRDVPDHSHRCARRWRGRPRHRRYLGRLF